MIKKIIITLTFCILFSGCGKEGPLVLPKDKLDKSVITYPCDDICMEEFEAEKQRQQSVILQTD